MSPREQLSRKEINVETMVWRGKTNPEIAACLGSSEPVIKNQLRGVFDKLGVWSRVELALYIASHSGAKWMESSAVRGPQRHPQRLRRWCVNCECKQRFRQPSACGDANFPGSRVRYL